MIRRRTLVLLSALFSSACSGSSSSSSPPPPDDDGGGALDATADGAAPSDASSIVDGSMPADAALPDAPPSTTPVIDCPSAAGDAGGGGPGARVRLMAANTTSGTQQAYEDPGIRIFQGLLPDVAMVQELNYKAGTIRQLVDTAFGPSFCFARENRSGGIPNGVVSRFPIKDAGTWADPNVPDRAFLWARIDVPGSIDLWAVSVHLKMSTAATRDDEAKILAAAIQGTVPAGDYVAIGGDLNTDARTETAITDLAAVTVTSGPYPADQNGTDGTNASRARPYDWLVASPALDAAKTTLVQGASMYPNGLVFDSRVYTPLTEVAPVQAGDSAAPGMQHMAVVRDFVLP